MSYANIPPNLHDLFQSITDRLDKIERSGRFTAPPVASDPTPLRNGDVWLNTTANKLRYADATGAVVSVFTPGAANPLAVSAGITSAFAGNITITWPSGRFSQVPVVMATPNSVTSAMTSVTAVPTLTGVTLYGWNGTAANTTTRQAQFVAIQMSSSAYVNDTPQ